MFGQADSRNYVPNEVIRKKDAKKGGALALE